MSTRLNRSQQAAVDALAGRVLIGAGAGSGKTKTLAERFLAALSGGDGSEPAAPEEILTITFTEMAAGELAERIRATLRSRGSADYRRIEAAWISTIHGFCSRILRRYAIEAGLDPAFAVADTVDTGRLEAAAFESAAVAAVAQPAGAALFDAFEYADVFSAASGVARALKARRLDTSDLQVEVARPAEQLIEEAVSLFEAGERELSACGAATHDLAVQCAIATARLADSRKAALSGAELAMELWRTLNEWSAGRSNKQIGEVRKGLVERRAELLADAAASAEAPLLEAFRDLVSGYIDEYEAMKRDRGVLDFDDLQVRTLTLLESSPAIAERCRRMFRMVMVDEFQDTDELQTRIVSAMGGDDLCTVGDPCQSIYGFRGADLDVYRAHTKTMRDAGSLVFGLTENYRSHPDILEFVNEMFGSGYMFGDGLTRLSAAREETDPPLIPPDQPRVEIVVAAPEGSSDECRAVEARALAARLAALRDECDVRAGDIAVLLRTYTHAHVYAKALANAGFEVMVVGGRRFFELPEIGMMRTLTKAVANPHDDVALQHLLAGDLGRLSDSGLLRLARNRGAGQPLWEALVAIDDGMSDHDSGRVRQVREVLVAARAAVGDRPLADVLLEAVERFDGDLVFFSRGTEGRQAYANVLKFARMADEFERSGGAGAVGFDRDLDAKLLYREHTTPEPLTGEDAGAVRIMSVHSAKGLEFPVVAFADLGGDTAAERGIVRLGASDTGGLRISMRLPEGKSPNNRPRVFRELDARAKLASIEEGKRVFYVACTRAREVLLLSGTAALGADLEKGGESPVAWLRRSWPRLNEVEPGVTGLRLGDTAVRVEFVVPDPGDVADQSPATATEPREPDVARQGSGPPGRSPDRAPAHLSYSDIALYRRCGLRFKAERILGVGTLALPADGTDPRAFGTAVHAVLQLVEGGKAPKDERVDAITLYHRLGPAEKARLDRAVEAVVASHIEGELAGAASTKREWPFGVRLSANDDVVFLVGTIDAYARTGETALVVDCKTGTSGETAELRDRYSTQAQCYAIAALRDGCTAVRVAFVHPERLGADGQPEVIEFVYSMDDAPELERDVLEVHRRMGEGRFAAPSVRDETTCAGCAIADSTCSAPRRAGQR